MLFKAAILVSLGCLLGSVSADESQHIQGYGGDHLTGYGGGYEDHYRASVYAPAPVLSASPSISNRQLTKPRRRKLHHITRGVARHRHANRKLYAKEEKTPIDRIFGTYIFDLDTEEPDLPARSTLPWIQLATLATVVMGLNTIFAQLILGLDEAPNIPVPFLNPNGRSLQEASWDFSRSLELFEDNMQDSDLSESNFCTPRRLCEMRQLLTYVPSVDSLIRNYGMRVPGLRHQYQRAIDSGSAGDDCRSVGKDIFKSFSKHDEKECENATVELLMHAANYFSPK